MTRPHHDQTIPVRALDKAFELAARIGRLMQEALTERGLTPGRAEALLVLHQHGRPLVQRELAAALQCTPRHVTALVDVLEQQGWVRRVAHPTDRRATLLAITDRGRDAAEWMATKRRDIARALLGDLSDADLTAFVTVADQLLGGVARSPVASYVD